MRHRAAVLTFLTLAACGAARDPAPVADGDEGPVISLGEIATSRTGTCFARMAGVTETRIVTELVEVEPEVKDPNGVILSPAIFRNVSRPQTVQVAEGARFETVCPQRYTPNFVATLQRALIVRRAYAGAVTGLMDAETSLAVQRFQRPLGIDSPLLATSVARDLGLIALDGSSA